MNTGRFSLDRSAYLFNTVTKEITEVVIIERAHDGVAVKSEDRLLPQKFREFHDAGTKKNYLEDDTRFLRLFATREDIETENRLEKLEIQRKNLIDEMNRHPLTAYTEEALAEALSVLQKCWDKAAE